MNPVSDEANICCIINATASLRQDIDISFRDLGPLLLEDKYFRLSFPKIEVRSFGLRGKETIVLKLSIRQRSSNFSHNPLMYM